MDLAITDLVAVNKNSIMDGLGNSKVDGAKFSAKMAKCKS